MYHNILVVILVVVVLLVYHIPEIISAVQEERFTRVKNDKNFPINSIKYILEENNLNIEDIDAFVFYEKPLLKFESLIETYLAFSPMGLKSFIKAIPL